MKNRWFIFTLIFITISLGIWSASSLKMETDVSTYNLASYQDIASYEAFIERLGVEQGEYGIVILEKPSGWNTLGDFNILKEIIDFWEVQPQIGKVSSILDVDYPKQGIMHLSIEPFLDLNNKKRFEKRLENYEQYYDIFQKFLSKNRKYTIIFLETSTGISAAAAERLEALNFGAQGIEVHYLQYDLIQKQLESHLQKDTILLGLISLLLILAGFYFLTHSLKGLGLITLMVAFNISATFIVMNLLNMSFTMHMITVPCIITVLSFTDIMHILYHQKELQDGCATDQDLRKAIISEVKMPLLLTSLTNIFGFFMFMVLAENIHLFNYALASIASVSIAYLSSRFLVIRLMNKEAVYLKRDDFQWFYAFHQSCFQWLSHRKKSVLFLFILANMAIISLVVSTFRIDNAEKDFSISDASLTRGREIMETAFFGKKRAEIFLTIKNGTVWDKPILNQIENIENRIDSLFAPLYINSPTLVVKRYHRYESNGRTKAFSVPKRLSSSYKKELAKYAKDLGGKGIIGDQAEEARILFGFADLDLPSLREKYEQLRQVLEAENNPAVHFELTGLQYLSDEATHSFANKILIGFGASIVFSSVFILLWLKSVRIGFGVLLVNLFPIFIALGLLILLGVTITPLTLFLLSILLGVCVDDSIYLVTQNRFKSSALHILPIFITSIVLSLGFMSLSFSSFSWVQPFGWVFLLGISLAYFLDVFILTLFFDHD